MRKKEEWASGNKLLRENWITEKTEQMIKEIEKKGVHHLGSAYSVRMSSHIRQTALSSGL